MSLFSYMTKTLEAVLYVSMYSVKKHCLEMTLLVCVLEACGLFLHYTLAVKTLHGLI